MTGLSEGEFRDNQHATVSVAGKPHEAFAIYVRKHGKRAATVVNRSNRPITANASFHGNPSGALLSATQEMPESQPCSGQVTIGGRSVLVAMEK